MFGRVDSWLGVGLIAFLAMFFLVGFIPGFYLSFVIFTKVKLHPLVALVPSFIIGLYAGFLGFSVVSNVTSALQPINPYFVGAALPITVALEIVLLLLHFSRSRKPKKKVKST